MATAPAGTPNLAPVDVSTDRRAGGRRGRSASVASGDGPRIAAPVPAPEAAALIYYKPNSAVVLPVARPHRSRSLKEFQFIGQARAAVRHVDGGRAAAPLVGGNVSVAPNRARYKG
jgi:hypothetical protein